MSFQAMLKAMSDFVYRSDLEEALQVSKVKTDVFQNSNHLFIPPGARGVFGGTLVAQSLYAAIKTVPETFFPNSFHSYFLIGADNKDPVFYHVTRLRDGNKFATREVKAYQRDTLIFTQTVSFGLETSKMKKPKQELKHNKPPPNHTPFEKYLTAHESFQKGAIESGLIKPDAQYALHNFMRRFDEGPTEYFFTEDFWKTGNEPGNPDKDKKPHEIVVDFFLRLRKKVVDPQFHYVALAYLTDAYILISVMKFHHRPLYSSVFSVSLDHSVYFHKPVDVNDILQFSVEHPKSGDNRQLMLGHVYNKDTEMVASVVQEGLVVINDGLLKAKI